jgi:glycine hydroxymethyltransferase
VEQSIFDLVDFEVFPGLQGGPHINSIAGIAVGLEEAMQPEFKVYAQQVVKNAQFLAKKLEAAGYDVVSGGTDKHLILLDLRRQQLSGWVAAWALEAAGIVANRNTVPHETASPFYPSGLRLGTPAITTRGMKEAEMEKIGNWIIQVLQHVADKKMPEDKADRKKFTREFLKTVKKDPELKKIKEQVKEFAKGFAVP